MTNDSIDACGDADVDPADYLDRHVTGDWGDKDEQDKQANDESLVRGGRLFSAYTLPTKARLWVITEADRSVTTLLTPMEY